MKSFETFLKKCKISYTISIQNALELENRFIWKHSEGKWKNKFKTQKISSEKVFVGQI